MSLTYQVFAFEIPSELPLFLKYYLYIRVSLEFTSWVWLILRSFRTNPVRFSAEVHGCTSHLSLACAPKFVCHVSDEWIPPFICVWVELMWLNAFDDAIWSISMVADQASCTLDNYCWRIPSADRCVFQAQDSHMDLWGAYLYSRDRYLWQVNCLSCALRAWTKAQ